MSSLAYCAVRCGVSEAQEVTPAERISRIRCPINSGLMGSE